METIIITISSVSWLFFSRHLRFGGSLASYFISDRKLLLFRFHYCHCTLVEKWTRFDWAVDLVAIGLPPTWHCPLLLFLNS